MEFRLSENTVSDYATYKTERDKYTSQGWKPLKNWFVDNGFKSSFDNHNSENYPYIPIKNGSNALGNVVIQVAQKFTVPISANAINTIVGGCKDSTLNNNCNTDANCLRAQEDGDGGTAVVLTKASGLVFNDGEWSYSCGANSYILLVRPL